MGWTEQDKERVGDIADEINATFERMMRKRFESLDIDPKLSVWAGRWHQRFLWRLVTVYLMAVPVVAVITLLLGQDDTTWSLVSLCHLIVQVPIHAIWWVLLGSSDAWCLKPKVELDPRSEGEDTSSWWPNGSDRRVSLRRANKWIGFLDMTPDDWGRTNGAWVNMDQVTANNPRVTPQVMCDRITKARSRLDTRRSLRSSIETAPGSIGQWLVGRWWRRRWSNLERSDADHEWAPKKAEAVIDGDPVTFERMMGQIYVTKDEAREDGPDEAEEERPDEAQDDSVNPRPFSVNGKSRIDFEVCIPGQHLLRQGFSAESVTIGSGPAAMLRVRDGSVANLHAVINIECGTAQLLDLGSVAGTMLNNEPISNATFQPGCFIKVGEVEILVLPSAPASPTVGEEPS